MIFRHGGEEIRSGLVLGLEELAAPVTAEAVTDSAKESHEVNGRLGTTTALIFVVRDVQAQMESVFNGPVLAIVFEPLIGIWFWTLRENARLVQPRVSLLVPLRSAAIYPLILGRWLLRKYSSIETPATLKPKELGSGTVRTEMLSIR